MSMTNAFGRSATRSKPSLSRPTGLGVWKVPSASQRSCHASSIRCASAGVYRYGGGPAPAGRRGGGVGGGGGGARRGGGVAGGGGAGWCSGGVLLGRGGAGTGGGQKKTP